MSPAAVCDDGVTIAVLTAICPACGNGFRPTGRGRFCSPACRQRAYRMRHQTEQPTADDLVIALGRQRRLVDQTVYQCTSCEERYLGERRCPGCNLMNRKLSLGGLLLPVRRAAHHQRSHRLRLARR
jgi:hypothetical protein